MIIVETIGWIATVFRGAGMLCKQAQAVKYLVSIGNFFWMLNGILTHNTPLIASNAFCLAVILWDVAYVYFKKKRAPKVEAEKCAPDATDNI